MLIQTSWDIVSSGICFGLPGFDRVLLSGSFTKADHCCQWQNWNGSQLLSGLHHQLRFGLVVRR